MSTKKTRTTQQSADERDLQAARDEWMLSNAAFADQRIHELADQQFEAGEHWTAAELAWKKNKKKPAFTMDQVSGQVAKVTNQPVHRILITPNGGGADPTSAEMWQGLCRRVENLSNAEDVYKYARRHAIVMGRGWWRVRNDVFASLEYREDGQYDASTLNQDIRIEPILNQHSVYPDPRCRLLDFSDMRFCVITDDLEWSEFTRLYGDKAEGVVNYASYGSLFQGTGDCPPTWASQKTIRVAERYWIEDQDVQLCVLKAGTVLQPGAEPLRAQTVVVKDPKATYPKDAIVREHTFRIPKVRWMKFIWGKVLERAEVPGRYVPVVQVVGERRIVDGKVDYRGMVRMSKGPQRYADFMESRLAECVDQAAYDTWVIDRQSVNAEDVKAFTEANIERPGALLYDSTPTDGDPRRLNPPQHITVAANVAPVAMAAQRAGMALRAVLGVPDVTPEELRPEQSGRAIRARQQEQQQATSHYADAVASGIRHTARIIMSMGRTVWDVPQILRITGADEKPIEVVPYAGVHEQAAQAMAQPSPSTGADAAQLRHLLRVDIGDYDVTLQAGKGYATGRQEAVESVTQMVQAYPPIAPKAIPVILKNSDFPGAQELAKSLEPAPNAGMVPIEQAQQAQMVIDRLTEMVHDLQQQLDQKHAELATKQRIAADQNETKLLLQEMQNRMQELELAVQVAQTAQQADDAALARREGYVHDVHRRTLERQTESPPTGAGA